MRVEVLEQHPVGAGGVARHRPSQEPAAATRPGPADLPIAAVDLARLGHLVLVVAGAAQPQASEHEDRDHGDGEQDPEHAEGDRDGGVLVGRQWDTGRHRRLVGAARWSPRTPGGRR